MRVSQGMPVGAKAKLYDPDSFHDREEVIIYSREEFKRTYVAMHNQVHDIFLMERLWDQEDNKKLMGQWYWIMGKIHNWTHFSAPSQAKVIWTHTCTVQLKKEKIMG
jgi:hypothetical protein